ncbi:MAG: GWxTD domain-containing protein [Ignavibacteria bacterium]
MKKLILTFIITIFFNVYLFAGNLFYYVDYSIFRDVVKQRSSIDITFAFKQEDLKFKYEGAKFSAQVLVRLIVKSKGQDVVLFDNTFGIGSSVNDTAKLTDMLIGQQTLILNTGEYNFRLVATDNNNPTNVDSAYFDVKIPMFEAGVSQLSDIQVALKIERASEPDGMFYKNGLEVIPNILFGNNLNRVYYYFEVYFLKSQFTKGNTYLITELVEDAGKKVVFGKEKEIYSEADAFADIGEIHIDSLQSGSYNILITLLDKSTNQRLSASKKFYVYNTKFSEQLISSDSKGFLNSEYVKMDENTLNDEYNKTIYIRTNIEENEFERLKTLDEKRKFMFNFWLKRDNVPSTPINEYKIDYFKRVNEANKLFKQGFTEGWKTDRGRVYIVYGVPSEIERHSYDAETKAYEVWTYDYLEGGVQFVFAESQIASGLYFLIHSTKRGEMRNDNWMNEVKKSL